MTCQSKGRPLATAGHRRKIGAGVAALALVLSAAACGSNGGSETVTTLSLWTNLTVQAQADIIQAQATTCAEGMGLTLEFESVPFADMYTKLQNSFASGAGPDIMNTTVAGVAFAQGSDYIVPLDSVIDQIGQDDFVPATLAQVTKDGQIWALPDFALHSEIWYRTDLFEAAGVTEMPQSWQEVLDLAVKLQADNPGVDGFVLPLGRVQMAAQILYQFLYSDGIRTFDEDGTFTLGDDPAAVEAAIQYIADVYAAGVSPEAAINWAWNDFRGAFVQGSVAMTIDNGAVVGLAADENPDMLSKMSAFPIPGPVAGTPGQGNLGGGYTFMVGKSNSDREAKAKELVSCMASIDNTVERVNSRPVFALPARSSVEEAPGYVNHPVNQQFADLIEMIRAETLPVALYYGLEGGLNTVVSTIEGTSFFGEQLQGVVAGQITAADAATNIIDEMRTSSGQ
jgi:ABC-type glycerol-3-phosphate transport system substrate-binding protein